MKQNKNKNITKIASGALVILLASGGLAFNSQASGENILGEGSDVLIDNNETESESIDDIDKALDNEDNQKDTETGTLDDNSNQNAIDSNKKVLFDEFNNNLETVKNYLGGAYNSEFLEKVKLAITKYENSINDNSSIKDIDFANNELKSLINDSDNNIISIEDHNETVQGEEDLNSIDKQGNESQPTVDENSSSTTKPDDSNNPVDDTSKDENNSLEDSDKGDLSNNTQNDNNKPLDSNQSENQEVSSQNSNNNKEDSSDSEQNDDSKKPVDSTLSNNGITEENTKEPSKENTLENLPYKNKTEFIDLLSKYSDKALANKIFPSVMIGQALHESGNGMSKLTINDFNIFGIKSNSKEGATEYSTLEYVDGKFIKTSSYFKHFNSFDEAIDYYLKLLNGNIYAKHNVTDAKSADEQLKRIAEAGYATDPEYISKVLNVIKTNDLYKFDKSSEDSSNSTQANDNNNPIDSNQSEDENVSLPNSDTDKESSSNNTEPDDSNTPIDDTSKYENNSSEDSDKDGSTNNPEPDDSNTPVDTTSKDEDNSSKDSNKEDPSNNAQTENSNNSQNNGNNGNNGLSEEEGNTTNKSNRRTNSTNVRSNNVKTGVSSLSTILLGLTSASGALFASRKRK